MILHKIDGKYNWIEPIKKKDRGGDDIGPAPRIRKYEGSRYSTKAPGTVQQNIHGIQTGNQEYEHPS